MQLIETWLEQDLCDLVSVKHLEGNIFTGDSEGNLIGVRITKGGYDQPLSGACNGFFIRADGTTVLLSGTIEDNKAYVVLSKPCYSVSGQFSLVIKIDTTTVGACSGRVYRSMSEVVSDPDDVIPTISELTKLLNKEVYAERELNLYINDPDTDGLWIVQADFVEKTTYTIHDAKHTDDVADCTNPGFKYPGTSSAISPFISLSLYDPYTTFDGVTFYYHKLTAADLLPSEYEYYDESTGQWIVEVEEPYDEAGTTLEERNRVYFKGINREWADSIYLTYKVNIKEFWQDVADSVAKEFNPNTSYRAGEYCYYNGKLYRFIKAHAGVWAAEDVEDCTVAGGLYKNDLAMGLFGKNVSNVETWMDEIQEEWDYQKKRIDEEIEREASNNDETLSSLAEMQSSLLELEDLLESEGLAQHSRLNRPNLLKQNWWEMTNSKYVIFGSGSRYTSDGAPYLKGVAEDKKYVYTEKPSDAEIEAADYYYVHTETDAETGETTTEYWIFKDEDGIRASVATLTGDDIITEPDGEVYDKALQFTITKNTTSPNIMETLFYPRGHDTNWRKEGEELRDYMHNIGEFENGQEYTASCYVRVISGTCARCAIGWGGNYTNYMGYEPYTGAGGKSDYIEVTGSKWKRISYSFTPNVSQARLVETTEEVTDEEGNTYNRIVTSAKWQNRAIFGICRAYNAVVQMTGFRLVKGGLYLPTKLDAILERIDDLEEMIVNNGGNA